MDVDEVECSYELVRKCLRDILLKECDLSDLGLVFSGEFGGGDIAGENLNIIAITDARQGDKGGENGVASLACVMVLGVPRPRACCNSVVSVRQSHGCTGEYPPYPRMG
jgi:hypothetical protein